MMNNSVSISRNFFEINGLSFINDFASWTLISITITSILIILSKCQNFVRVIWVKICYEISGQKQLKVYGMGLATALMVYCS